MNVAGRPEPVGICHSSGRSRLQDEIADKSTDPVC